jgi:hypothetical protein
MNLLTFVGRDSGMVSTFHIGLWSGTTVHTIALLAVDRHYKIIFNQFNIYLLEKY